MPNFSKLQEHADKLSYLLKNREMGRASWTMFVGEHWKAIADMWSNQRDDTGGITPERAKELEGAVVVYSVGSKEDQVVIISGILTDVGPDYFDKRSTTALLNVGATVGDLPDRRRDFDKMLITKWNHTFEHVEGAKACAVSILKRKIDVINKEIEKYD